MSVRGDAATWTVSDWGLIFNSSSHLYFKRWTCSFIAILVAEGLRRWAAVARLRGRMLLRFNRSRAHSTDQRPPLLRWREPAYDWIRDACQLLLLNVNGSRALISVLGRCTNHRSDWMKCSLSVCDFFLACNCSGTHKASLDVCTWMNILLKSQVWSLSLR